MQELIVTTFQDDRVSTNYWDISSNQGYCSIRLGACWLLYPHNNPSQFDGSVSAEVIPGKNILRFHDENGECLHQFSVNLRGAWPEKQTFSVYIYFRQGRPQLHFEASLA